MKTKVLIESDILFLEGDINYTIIYLKGGSILVSSQTLMRHEEKFSGFVRISRKYLVNPMYSLGLVRDENALFLKVDSGEKLRISRRKIKYVTRFLGFRA